MSTPKVWENKHAYLDKCPIDKDAEYLILGTIHPYQGEDICEKGNVYQPALDFFYGNDYSLWQILAETFKTGLSQNISKSSSESEKKQVLENIKAFLSAHKIAVSDTIKACVRRSSKKDSYSPDASDGAIINDDTLKLNMGLLDQIKASKIKKIFFTSKATRVFFSRIFWDSQANAPRKDLQTSPTASKLITGMEFKITDSFFGREIDAFILPSPSANAVRGKARLYSESQYYKNKDYNGWRASVYKTAFQSILK